MKQDWGFSHEWNPGKCHTSESGLAKTHVETVLFLQKIGEAVHDREREGREREGGVSSWLPREFPLTNNHLSALTISGIPSGLPHNIKIEPKHQCSRHNKNSRLLCGKVFLPRQRITGIHAYVNKFRISSPTSPTARSRQNRRVRRSSFALSITLIFGGLFSFFVIIHRFTTIQLPRG